MNSIQRNEEVEVIVRDGTIEIIIKTPGARLATILVRIVVLGKPWADSKVLVLRRGAIFHRTEWGWLRWLRGCLPWLRLFVAIAVGTIATSSLAYADVLYDRTGMTDEQAYNDKHQSFIGGFAQTNQLWDVQTADDFELDDSYEITTIVADFVNISPKGIPADGFLVEFFPIETENCLKGPGPCPSEVAVAQAFTRKFTETPFEDTVFGQSGHRFTIDLTGSNITLEPGTWWISVVAVDETELGLKYRLILTTEMDDGNAIHRRSGGVDHGNGYPGPDLPDWHPTPASAPPGDAAIRIEGTLVQPGCPWDIDGSADVGVKDLLILLGAWGLCPPKGDCPADFDGSGDVGVKDLLILLGVWGPCP